MDLGDLLNERATHPDGFGELLDAEARAAVVDAVRSGRYPPAYSPTGQWDEAAYGELADSWVAEKLLRAGHLDYLLLANEDIARFRHGMRLSFRHFLIARKKRSALENLFHRADAVLTGNPALFRAFGGAGKAGRLWGLTTWGEEAPPYQDPEDELIRVGLRIPGFRAIRYRPDARKLSPILSEDDLRAFLRALLDAIDRTLSLSQMMVVCAWRFDLLEAQTVSLDEPIGTSDSDSDLTIGATLSAGSTPEDEAILAETARSIYEELQPRQRAALSAYAELGATYTSVADQLACSKSTVENELRRAWTVIKKHTDSDREAEDVYGRVLELLRAG